MTPLPNQLKRGETPDVSPINGHDYAIRRTAKGKCHDEDGHYVKQRVVYVVKSALDHFARRAAIRKTWGFEKRFSDVPIRTVFLLGSGRDVGVQEKGRAGERAARFIFSYFLFYSQRVSSCVEKVSSLFDPIPSSSLHLPSANLLSLA